VFRVLGSHYFIVTPLLAIKVALLKLMPENYMIRAQ